MMYVKTVEKEVYVKGPVQMLTPYRVMRSKGFMDLSPAPSSESSDIAKIRDFFVNNPKDAKFLLRTINNSIENAYITVKDIESGFKAKYGYTDVDAKFSDDEDDEDMSDFMD